MVFFNFKKKEKTDKINNVIETIYIKKRIRIEFTRTVRFIEYDFRYI